MSEQEPCGHTEVTSNQAIFGYTHVHSEYFVILLDNVHSQKIVKEIKNLLFRPISELLPVFKETIPSNHHLNQILKIQHDDGSEKRNTSL